jgi:hypothetical protein
MSRPKTGPYLSDQMRRVLGACAASRDGVAAVAELVAARMEYGQGQAVAKASLSRILRRLWCLGLVELSDAAYRPEVTDPTFARVREQARYLEMATPTRSSARCAASGRSPGLRRRPGRSTEQNIATVAVAPRCGRAGSPSPTRDDVQDLLTPAPGARVNPNPK